MSTVGIFGDEASPPPPKEKKFVDVYNFYFKKTFFGNVLMIKYRTPTDNPGGWKDKSRRATRKETLEFFDTIKYQKSELGRIKREHPEIFI